MKYIDVSEHQGVIDWEKVRVNGVMIRAGYGFKLDKYWQRNVSECNRLKIPCGAYWFSYAKNIEGATEEARRLIDAVSQYRIELPLAYDLEYDTLDNMKRHGVTPVKSLCTNMVNTFCQTVEDAGYYAMYYANPDFLTRWLYITNYDLWLAQWPDEIADLKQPPRKCGIWQWGTSAIDGIKYPVDTNEAYNDYATLIRSVHLNHLEEKEKKDPVALALAWAKNCGINVENPDSPATQGDLIWLFYEYTRRYGDEDIKLTSGLLD